MIGRHDILLHARLDEGTLEAWLEAGWIARRDDYSELDLARACLIRDLRDELGVNDEGVEVVLDLLDQVHGLRRALRHLAASLQALPEPLRQEALAALRAAGGEGPEGE